MYIFPSEFYMNGNEITMFYSLLSGISKYRCAAADYIYYPVMLAATFLISFFTLKYLMKLLPKDHGRQFAVNGALSEGKPRGAGIIMITDFVLCCALFVPFNAERAIYMVLIYAAMITGFLDDAAKTPWGELKKGLLDLVITIGITANFMLHNTSDIYLFGEIYHIPLVVFAVLCMILVWASINVTNCCDGVDGMCGSLSVCTLGLFLLYNRESYYDSLGYYKYMAWIMIMMLLAYLWFNCSPSKLLMGDAGSRAIGVFLAIISLKSGNPFMFIFLACMIIVDGGASLVKLSFRRFLKMKNFMENIRTPIHDHWRKNLGASDTRTVTSFVIIQLVIGLAAVFVFTGDF